MSTYNISPAPARLKDGRIFTHVHVDVDAVLSVSAVRMFNPHMTDAEIVFVPAFWDGTAGRDGNLPVMEDGDIAVDLDAGGKGIKGEKTADGRVGSAFLQLVEHYCSAEQQAALARLVDFVDRVDAGESSWDEGVIALPQVVAAIKLAGGRDGDLRAVEFAQDFLRGFLAMEESRLRADAEADAAEIVTRGDARVAIVREAKERGTNAALYGRGVHAVVFVNGMNLGATRPPEHTFRIDSEAVKAVIGNEEGWFCHPAGFLVARGSFKSPATSMSRVDPVALAEAVADTIAESLAPAPPTCPYCGYEGEVAGLGPCPNCRTY